jgi:O-antigen/teichoic acid export membrane protein
MTATTIEHSSLRRAVVNGLAWKAGTQAVAQASRVVVAVVVARLLTPHDYGIAGMVVVFSSLVFVFADLSLGAALVQRPRISEADRSTVFWLSLGAGAIFTATGMALAGPIADFYGEPAVRPLFMALSCGFIVTSFGTTQSALLTREMNFKALELRQMGGILVGAVAGIVLAARGAGPWAIIGQQLATIVISTICLWWFSSWRPSLVFSFNSVRQLGGFSANVFGTRLLFYVNRNLDNLLVGRFIGAAALGAYSLAYSVMLVPFNQIAGPVQEVLYPAFSRMQDDAKRIADVWIDVNRIVAALSLPALVGLMVVGPDFVEVVLGSKWRSATVVIQILAWVGLLQSIQRLNSSILQARDRTRDLFVYSIVTLVGSVLAFVGGLNWGIVGVATAYAALSTVLEPYYTWLTARSLGISMFRFFRGLAGVAQATVAMAAVLVPVRYLMVGAGVGTSFRLVLLIVLGCAVYVPLVAWRAPELRVAAAAIRRRRAAMAPGR